jgi:hypothetical protein
MTIGLVVIYDLFVLLYLDDTCDVVEDDLGVFVESMCCFFFLDFRFLFFWVFFGYLMHLFYRYCLLWYMMCYREGRFPSRFRLTVLMLAFIFLKIPIALVACMVWYGHFHIINLHGSVIMFPP